MELNRKKQRKFQIALIFVGLFLIIFTYFYKPYLNKLKVLENEKVEKKLDSVIDRNSDFDKNKTTSFESVEYKGLYDLDKNFNIKSENAYILNNEPNIVYMTSMHVILYLDEERVVNIKSNKGRYNKLTHDCFFEENVRAIDEDTKIFSEKLDLLASKNIAKIYDDVFLNYTTGTLEADIIDYNFITKHFKVSMFDDSAIKMKVIK
jgi:hypothetical protein